MLSEGKPWQSVFAQCLPLLKVSASPCLQFSTSVALLCLLTLFFRFLFYLLFIVQDLPGYLRLPCNRTMIL
jgi:hypothetical protein